MSHRWSSLPALAVSGWSGSGKTTLLEAVIPRLRAGGLHVAVVKHDVHGVDLDRPGKDSDRMFRAGADVMLQGVNESATRFHPETAPGLVRSLRVLAANHDLVLVEGHHETPLPKLWLLAEGESEPPPGVTGIRSVLPFGGNRIDVAVEAVRQFADHHWRARPVRAGVLVGGAATRMGRPKQLLELGGRSFVERLADLLGREVDRPVLLGAGAVPESLAGLDRLPDAPELAGPAAGLVSALRWDPDAAWLVAACDQPLVEAAAVTWLLGERCPGRWAVMPRTGDDTVEPLLAVYEPQAAVLLAEAAAAGTLGLRFLAGHPSVASPRPPPGLVHCWRSIDTPDEYLEVGG